MFNFATYYYWAHAYEARKYTEIQGSGGGAFFKAYGLHAPRTLCLISFILSIFLAVACEKELTHYPEIVAYHAESKTLDVATSDSVGKFNVKVKTFVAQHPDATQDPLYPEIQKNIKANLLRLSLTIDDEWDGETFIEY